MVIYRCDGCARAMREGDLRYVAKIDVRAAFSEIQISLADLVRDHRQEMLDLIERMKDHDPRELEEQVYKQLRLDLCPGCYQAFIKNPLQFHPEQGEREAEIDIEKFLRELGYGKTSSD